MGRVIIGTRGSTLALVQAEWVQRSLRDLFPGEHFAIEKIKTTGDSTQKLLNRHAEEVGFFTKEIEDALLNRTIDVAVHSLKDLPTQQPEGLEITAVPKRENPQDALVTEKGLSLHALSENSRIGTGSARRKAQLLSVYPKLKVLGMRGNLNTRLRKLKERACDALVLAVAGLERMKIDPDMVWPIPLEIMLPAPGQGALALETREEDQGTRRMVQKLDHPESHRCVTAERSLLAHLGGGCQLPLGALGRSMGEETTLEAILLSEDGRTKIHSRVVSTEGAETVGKRLADQFFKEGAEALLNG